MTIHLSCELCGKPRGLSIDLGELRKQFPDIKPTEENKYLHGMCDKCAKHLADGGIFFVDEHRRCISLTVKATKEKIDREMWGKVIRIPRSAMDELIRSWLREKIKQPPYGPPPPPGQSSEATEGSEETGS